MPAVRTGDGSQVDLAGDSWRRGVRAAPAGTPGRRQSARGPTGNTRTAGGRGRPSARAKVRSIASSFGGANIPMAAKASRAPLPGRVGIKEIARGSARDGGVDGTHDRAPPCASAGTNGGAISRNTRRSAPCCRTVAAARVKPSTVMPSRAGQGRRVGCLEAHGDLECRGRVHPPSAAFAESASIRRPRPRLTSAGCDSTITRDRSPSAA